MGVRLVVLLVSTIVMLGCASQPFPITKPQPTTTIIDSLQAGLSSYEAADYSGAFSRFYPIAVEGDSEAQFYVGTLYDNGLGVPQSRSKALAWYSKAAQQGHLGACNNIAVLYDNGYGVQRDSALAIKWFRRAAEQGYRASQMNLGVIYANGRGVAKDGDEAVRWLTKAAEQGDAEAQINLAMIYENGVADVKIDLAAAAKWYQAASELGDANAMYHLGRIYLLGAGVQQNTFLAAKWLRDSADSDVIESQIALARLFRLGIGVQKDVNESAYWYRRAAELNDVDAQVTLGEMLLRGEGDLAPDEDEARTWLLKAAGSGNQRAQFLCGEALAKSDSAQASRWWRLAARQGNPWAAERLSAWCKGRVACAGDANWSAVALDGLQRLARSGDAEAQTTLGIALLDGSLGRTNRVLAEGWLRQAAEHDSATARLRLSEVLLADDKAAKRREGWKWLEAAANAGDSTAQRTLADFYRRGMANVGIARDVARAMEWYQRAAEGGDVDAMVALGQIKLSGDDVARDDRGAAEWFLKAAQAGSIIGQYVMAQCYQVGRGVERSDVKARDWSSTLQDSLQRATTDERIGLQKALAGWYLVDGGDQGGANDLFGNDTAPAAGVEASGPQFYINGPSAYIREIPGASGHVIGELAQGQTVVALETRGDWVRVKPGLAQAGDGWVYKSLLSRSE